MTTDKDNVKLMEDLNWKPATQCWKEQVEKLEKKLVGLYPEHADQPFICSYDKKGSPPEYLNVCPAYGSDATYHYTLKGLYTQQGG